ncbi:MAG: hypothetical protein ACKOBR_07945, partial [Actinomycetota bacterium]
MTIEKKADKAEKATEKAPVKTGKSTVDPDRARATERAKALEAALGQIDKQFGAGSVMRMGEKEAM